MSTTPPEPGLLVQYQSEISLFASLATIAALLLAAWGLRATSKSVQANTLMQIHRDSRDLAQTLIDTPNLMETWSLKPDAGPCPQAESIMQMMLSHYAAIHFQWRSGTLDKRFWPAYKAEMQRFVGFGYIQTRIAQADTYGRDFGAFLRDLDPIP